MDPCTLFHKRIQQFSSYISQRHLRTFLSKNPSITIDMVLEDIARNPSHKDAWTFENLCRTIPLEQLVANGIRPSASDTTLLLQGPFFLNLTIDTLLQTYHTQHHLDYHWGYLTQHRNITLEDIQAHPELPWDYSYIYSNPNFEFHHLPHYRHYLDHHTYDYLFIQLSQKATYEQITQHPDYPWNYRALSSPHIQKEHLLELFEYFKKKMYITPYLIARACTNPNVTFEELCAVFGEENVMSSMVCYAWAAHSPTFTLDDFQRYSRLAHAHEKWGNGNLVGFSAILPLDIILAHQGSPNANWCWLTILKDNKTLTYESHTRIPRSFIQNCESDEKTWRIKWLLSQNKHLPAWDKKRLMEDLLQCPNYFKNLDLAGLILASPLFLEPTPQEIRQYFASKCIVRHLVEALSNPQYHQCRKRLTREHNTMHF